MFSCSDAVTKHKASERSGGAADSECQVSDHQNGACYFRDVL